MKLVRKGLASNTSHDRWLEPGDDDRIECKRCGGDTSYVETTTDRGKTYELPCQKCKGRGWVPAPEEPASARETARKLEELLGSILGRGFAQEVANNVAQALTVDEDEEAEPISEIVRTVLKHRLRTARTGSPGIGGFQQRADAATAALRAMRQRQAHFARVLKEAAGKIEPNSGRASTLNGRSSMDTSRVGRDVDPDRYTGARGKALDAAMNRYETFHAKRPLRTIELPHDLPKQVVPVGQVISTMYRTDKWHEDGDDEDYKHVHDNSRGGKDTEYKFGKGVIAYEPAREAGKSVIESGGKRTKVSGGKAVRLPVHAPGALSLLGYCLGVFVHRFDDDEVYELNPRGCYLFCSPKGDMLAIYSPEAQPDGSKGFLMIMAGGGLRVLKDGIDG